MRVGNAGRGSWAFNRSGFYPGFGDFGADEGGVPYAKELQAVIRAFPKSFDALKASQMLDAAAEFGRKAIAALPAAGGGATADVDRATQAARDAADKWRAKIPWFWQSNPVYVTGSPEHKSVLALISKVYGGASGAQGAREVVAKARAELKEDIKKNIAELPRVGWSFTKNVALVAGAGAGLLLFGPTLLRFFRGATAPVRANPRRRRKARR